MITVLRRVPQARVIYRVIYIAACLHQAHCDSLLKFIMQAAPSQHCRLHSCRRILLRTPFRSGLSALGRRAALPRQADAAATSYRSAQSHRLICSAEARTSQDFAKTFEELSDACEYLKAVPPSEVHVCSPAYLSSNVADALVASF